MGTVSTVKRCAEVTLLRPGADPQPFALEEGSTLADLFRAAGGEIRASAVTIDGRAVEEAVILKSGMTIMIVPEPAQLQPKRSWQDTLGKVQDTPAFREMIAAGRAIREDDSEDTCSKSDMPSA